MLKTYSRSQLIPTNKIAAGTTILIHQYRKRGKAFFLPSESSFKDLFIRISFLGSSLIQLKFMQIPAFDIYGWIYNTKNSKVKG